MKIIRDKPPIWDEAHRHFEIDDAITFYTYGDILYNPAGIEVTADLAVHEYTHWQQQEDVGGPEIWWRRYFDDRRFRAQQEAEAYARQYRFFCRENLDRNTRFRYLCLLGSFMASPLYKLETGVNESMALIKKLSNVK